MAVTKADVDRESVRRYGFARFVQLAWPLIEAVPLVWEPHMQLVCDHYQAIADQEIRDCVVNVPPGTSKSKIGSVLFPAWVWSREIKLPKFGFETKFLFTSYDEKLSLDFAKASRSLMLTDWYKERWPHVEIEGGERAPAGMFENTAGGIRVSTMFGGAATGRHAHILLADDPHKPADLNSGGEQAMAVLDDAWKTWTGTFCRRVADAATFARVVVMQRLHEADLAGRMLKDSKVVHLCLPMRFEPHRAYQSQWGSDWRTEEGELLCPIRFPESYVNDVQSGPTGLTARDWAAQMQQRPAPEAGALFLREWFAQRWEVHPRGVRWLMSVDSSLKDNRDSDYCVIQVWAWSGAQYYLMDEVRARMAFSGQVAAVRSMRQKWPHVGQILVEDKANGTAIIDTLRRSVPGVIAVNPEGGKFARANAIEPILRAGNVWFPNAYWMGEFVEEFATFPVGSHDDRVDALSQALLWMSGRSRTQKFKKAMANAGNMLTRHAQLGYRR